MNLLLLIDGLEQMIQEGPRMPLGNRSLISVPDALDMIDKIRQSLPEQVRRAEKMAAETEKVLQQSRQEADRILHEAEEYVARLVTQSEVLERARGEAERIVQEAHDNAQEIRSGADAYADEVLGNLQKALERTLRTVQHGRQELDPSTRSSN